MPVTVRNADILFNDGTTQSTAAGGLPAHLAVGSVIMAFNQSTTGIFAGGTIAGSSLLINTSGTLSGMSVQMDGGFVQAPNFGAVSGSRGGNVGAFTPNGMVNLSGTWRGITPIGPRSANWSSYDQRTSISYGCGMFVRVA